MTLNDIDIKSLISQGKLSITDFSEDCIQPASYDLRLGKYAYVSCIDKNIILQNGDHLILEPGSFALVSSYETLKLPCNLRGRVGLRARYSLTGLINLSGPQIDPGFEGRLILGLVNLGPRIRRIGYMERVFTVEFDELTSSSSKSYDGIFKQIDGIPPSLIEAISTGCSESIPSIAKRLEKVDNKIDTLQKILYALIFPLVLAIITILVTILI